jgi:hypothetical protein
MNKPYPSSTYYLYLFMPTRKTTRLQDYCQHMEEHILNGNLSKPLSMGIMSDTYYVDTFVEMVLKHQGWDIVKMDLDWLKDVERYEPKVLGDMTTLLKDHVEQLKDKTKPLLFISGVSYIHNAFQEPIIQLLNDGIKLEGQENYIPLVMSGSRMYDFRYYFSSDLFNMRRYSLEDNRAICQTYDAYTIAKGLAAREFEEKQKTADYEKKMAFKAENEEIIHALYDYRQKMVEEADILLMASTHFIELYKNNPNHLTDDMISNIMQVRYTFDTYRKIFERDAIKPFIEVMYNSEHEARDGNIHMLKQAMKIFYLFNHLDISPRTENKYIHLKEKVSVPQKIKDYLDKLDNKNTEIKANAEMATETEVNKEKLISQIAKFKF